MSHCKDCDRYDKRIEELKKEYALLQGQLEAFDRLKRKVSFIKRIAWFIKSILRKTNHE